MIVEIDTGCVWFLQSSRYRRVHSFIYVTSFKQVLRSFSVLKGQAIHPQVTHATVRRSIPHSNYPPLTRTTLQCDVASPTQTTHHSPVLHGTPSYRECFANRRQEEAHSQVRPRNAPRHAARARSSHCSPPGDPPPHEHVCCTRRRRTARQSPAPTAPAPARQGPLRGEPLTKRRRRRDDDGRSKDV